MRSFTAFNIALLAVYLASLAVGLAMAYRLEPLSGDLTRIGGYSENDFGWRSPQFGLERPYAHRGFGRRPPDIVVLGDSFSLTADDSFRDAGGRPTYHRWTDFLAARTGLDIALFHLDDYTVGKLTDAPAYRRSPPKLLILEITERSLVERLDGTAADCAGPPATAAVTRLGFTPRPLPVVDAFRATRADPLKPPLGYAYNYLYFAGWRALGLKTEVAKLGLARADLFSNRRSGELLVYGQDLDKAGWDSNRWNRFACALMTISRRVEHDGRTSFLLLIVPDKLTAYSPYLKDRRSAGLSRLSSLLDRTGVPTVRWDRTISRLIASGGRDVYLPNDTHWSPYTHRRAAEDVYDYLLARRLIESNRGVAAAALNVARQAPRRPTAAAGAR